MPQNKEPVDENLLITFLNNNESLFTILGVFLVLAFIFNSPQLISSVNPQYQSTNEVMQFQCSINGTDFSIYPNGTNPVTQINCTENTIANLQSGSNANYYSSSSRAFSFICLLMALIVYLVICYNLYHALRECLRKIVTYFTKPASSIEVIRDCTILFIVPFFYQAAIWFVALLLKLFPDMMANAFFSTVLTILLIEFICVAMIASEIDNAVRSSKRKTLVLSCIFLIIGIIIVFIAAFKKDEPIILLTLALWGILFIAFGVRGLLRYMRIRNIIEVHDVI